MRRGRLSNPQTLNPYIYVLDDPVDLIDPSGLYAGYPGSCADTCGYISTRSEGVGGGGGDLVTWWNGQNSDTKTIIISSVILVGVGIATAGIGDAVLLPVVAGGGLGATISGGFYAATCGQHCTPEGYISHALSGGALGSLGGLAGPVSGAIGLEEGGLMASIGTPVLRAGFSIGGQFTMDAGVGKSAGDTLTDLAIAGTFGAFGGDVSDLRPTGSFAGDVALAARNGGRSEAIADVFGDAVAAARDAGFIPSFFNL